MAAREKSDSVLGQKIHKHLVNMGVETPMTDLVAASAEHKITKITSNMQEILETLGLDLTDDSLIETPLRVAKMYVNELYWGLNYQDFPKCTTVENKMGYDEMVIEKDIQILSDCFVAGTPVETPNGRVAIENIKEGDWVYSMNMETFELELKKAATSAKMYNEASKLVEVYTDNGNVTCTPDHRFYTNNRGWVEAKDLVGGDSITSLYRHGNVQATNNGRCELTTKDNIKKSTNKNKLVIPHGMDGADEAKIVYCLHNNTLPSDIRYMTIHHENEVSFDNRPENLTLMTIAEHNREHQRTQKLASSSVRKAAAAESSGRLDVRAKRASSVSSHWSNMTPEEYAARCAAMSAGCLSAGRNHKVIGVISLTKTAPTYCFEVPDNHNFFVNGMCAHNCEHHLRTIDGVAHIAYIPEQKVLGLSKLNRVADYFARRPQIQERLVEQIYHALCFILETDNVAVVIDAEHFCVKQRGIGDCSSHTITSKLGGRFKDDPTTRAEFMSFVSK